MAEASVKLGHPNDRFPEGMDNIHMITYYVMVTVLRTFPSNFIIISTVVDIFSSVLYVIALMVDTVDHHILLDRLHTCGIRGNAHKWMQSYLSQRSQVVNIRDTRSRCVQLPCGVPQGSVLGPLLFSIYCIELSSVFKNHQLSYHIYAGDSQLYVEFPRDQPALAVTAANRISRCITDVRAWLLLNNLMLNSDKT